MNSSPLQPRWRRPVETRLIARVVTALVAIPLLVLVVGWGGPWPFALLIFLVTAGALHEYFSIAFPDRPRERFFGMLFGLLVSMDVFVPGLADPRLWLGWLMIALFLSYFCMDGALKERYVRLGWAFLGIGYLGFLLPFWILLHRSPLGREWVFFVLLVVMVGDTAAYLVGSSIGRRKLAPEISPGKTVEGAAGSVAASLVVGLLAGRIFFPEVSSGEILLLSLTMSLLGQAGDLFESWIKRSFGVKDSGRLIPGHGGLMDRMDSLIFPVVFIAYYLRLFH